MTNQNTEADPKVPETPVVPAPESEELKVPVTPENTETNKDTVQPEKEENPNPTPEEPDPLEAYKKLFEETERAKMLEAARQEALKELEAKQAADRQRIATEQEAEKQKSDFADAAKKTHEAALALEVYDANGDPLKLDNDTVQKFIEPWQAYNTNRETAMQQLVYGNMANVVVNSLSEEARAEFAKRANGKPLDEYFSHYVELKAADTEAYKKLEADVALKVAAAEARGYAKGQRAPAGTPPVSGGVEHPITAKTVINNLFDAAVALSKDEITQEEYLKIDTKFRNS